jgi:hypothetical protein
LLHSGQLVGQLLEDIHLIFFFYLLLLLLFSLLLDSLRVVLRAESLYVKLRIDFGCEVIKDIEALLDAPLFICAITRYEEADDTSLNLFTPL